MADDIIKNYDEFIQTYDEEIKDGIWDKQSKVFRDFWNNKVLNNTVTELSDSEIDQIIRILDKHAKGNTKEDEAIAKLMISQGVWRKMFNEIKADDKLSSLLDGILKTKTDDEKINLINKLYEMNEKNKNSLTGRSGNAINALLFAYNPKDNLSVVSLREREKIITYFNFHNGPDFENNKAGQKIVISNKAIIEGFRTVGLQASPRTLSVFLYNSPLTALWRTDDDSPEAVPWGGYKHPETPTQIVSENNDPSLFYMESQLEDFIIENWERTDLGKKYDLIEENGEVVSQQYRTAIGRIDILAKEKETGQFVVIELKKGQTSDDTIGQLSRYMGWLQIHKTDGKPLKGIIIAAQYDERLYYALQMMPNVEVYLYKVDFSLQEFKK